MFCVPGLGFANVPGLGLCKKCPEYITVWCFFGGTPKNGETTAQPYLWQQLLILRHRYE